MSSESGYDIMVAKFNGLSFEGKYNKCIQAITTPEDRAQFQLVVKELQEIFQLFDQTQQGHKVQRAINSYLESVFLSQNGIKNVYPCSCNYDDSNPDDCPCFQVGIWMGIFKRWLSYFGPGMCILNDATSYAVRILGVIQMPLISRIGDPVVNKILKDYIESHPRLLMLPGVDALSRAVGVNLSGLAVYRRRGQLHQNVVNKSHKTYKK